MLKTNKRFLTLLIALTMVVSVFGAMPTFANDTDLVDITFTESTMFAVGLNNDDLFTLSVTGLIIDPSSPSGYAKQALDHPSITEWGTFDPELVDIIAVDENTAIIQASPTETGQTTISVSYDDFIIYSSVVVHGGTIIPSVDKITVTVRYKDQQPYAPFTQYELTVPLFKIGSNAFPNISGSFGAVLQNQPSVLHALLWALYSEYTAPAPPSGVPDDWNIYITDDGAYVQSINGLYYWTYTINGHYPGAACQQPLQPGDEVVWIQV